MNSTLPRLPILSTTPRATDRSPSSAASKSSNFSVELPQLMVRILTERSPRSASRSVAHRPEEILRGSLELFPAGLGAEVVAFAPVGVLQCLMRLYPHPADRIPLLPRKTCLGYRLVWLPPSEQGPVEPQIICDQACQQEPLAHELTALHTKHFRFLRVLQRPQRLLGTLLDRIHEEPSGSAPHLERDATGAPRHDRSFLPERLGDDKPEALADRLLYHHVREALKGIDLDVSHPGKVGEEVDLKIVFGCLPDLAVDLPSFRVVERHRASQRQLQPGHLRLDEPVGLYHPQRVLPRVEAGNLGYEGSLGLDADPPQQTARDAGVKLEVLRALRIDRRRNDLHALDWDVRRDEAAEREDRRIVAF